jgi:hypothetical protein
VAINTGSRRNLGDMAAIKRKPAQSGPMGLKKSAQYAGTCWGVPAIPGSDS